MAPTSKTAETGGRRKSGSKSGLLVTLNVSPSQLREIMQPESVKEETPVDVEESKETKDSPNSSTPAPAPANSNENASDSNAATPAAEGTPAPMGPPVEGSKKKGVKRSAPATDTPGDGTPKPRGKPGPKKKPRLEDGTIDHTNAAGRASGVHKLGPKANQGAINAGLRALDRSGKPCRKWAKGGFTLKSFTGVTWHIPRWTAPPSKGTENGAEDSAAASAEGGSTSNKENKENGVEPNSTSNSNSGADVEMQSVPSANAPSPAPIAIAAAS